MKLALRVAACLPVMAAWFALWALWKHTGTAAIEFWGGCFDVACAAWTFYSFGRIAGLDLAAKFEREARDITSGITREARWAARRSR